MIPARHPARGGPSAAVMLLIALALVGPTLWAQFDNTNILVEEAVNHIYQRRYKAAHTSLQRAFEQSPRNPLVHFNLGRLFEMTGNFSEAGKEYQLAATLDPSLVSARRGLARVNVELKRLRGEAQVQAMDQALQSPSSAPMSRAPVAYSQPMNRTLYQEPPARPAPAQPAPSARIETQPGRVTPPRAPTSVPTPMLPPMPANPGLQQISDQRLPPLPIDVASKLKATATTPEERRAEALLDEGKVAEAITLTTNLLEKNPDNPRLLFLAGKAYSIKGELFNAIKQFEQALRIDEHFHNAYYLLAQNYVKVNLLDDAIRNFLLFYAVKPQAKVALEIARTYERMGNAEKAQEFYRNANAMNPGNPNLQNSLTSAEADMSNDLYLRANHAFTLNHFGDAVNLFGQALETPGLKDTFRRDALRKLETARLRLQQEKEARRPAQEGFHTTRKVYGTVNLRYPQLANIRFKTNFTGPVTVEWRAYVARKINRYGREFLLAIKELSRDELDEMQRDRNDFRLNKHFNNQPLFLIAAQKGQFPPFAKEGALITFTGTTDWRFYDILNDMGAMVKLPAFEFVSAHPSGSF